MTTRPDACAALVTGALAWALLTGCSTDLNSRSTIGAVRTVPALAPAAEPGADTGPGPATARLDRGDWAAVEFRVPVDGTVHAPLLTTEPSFGDDHPRAHGLYPTADSALDLQNDPGGEAARGVVEPIRAMIDLAILPVRAILDPAWQKTQSPSMYKRWHSGEFLAGPLPEDVGASAGDGDDS